MPPTISAPTIITAHSNADFDCLSSMVAAQLLYPEASLVFPGSQEQSIRNFFIQSTTYLLNFQQFKDIDPDSVQRLVVCDTRQRSRLPHVAPLLEREADLEIHVYDHHPDTDEDLAATYEAVHLWGSTVAVLVRELRLRGLEPDAERATLMGLGLYEDTGSFTFDSTTVQDLEAGAWLRGRGMDVTVISDFLSKEISSEQVGILNSLLNSATIHNFDGVEVCFARVSVDRYVRDFALLVHKMMEIEQHKTVFALALMQDRVHIAARSRDPYVDVGTICSSLGGGGHSYAASATVKDKTPAQIEDELFGLLYSHIHPQLRVRSLMSSPPVAVNSTQDIDTACTVMTRFGLKAIPVLDAETGECRGILEHQLASRASAHGLGRFEIQEYMRRNISVLSPEDSLYQVVEIIIEQGQRLVPVLEQDRLVGVVTRTDLINWLVEEPARIPESISKQRLQERKVASLMRNRLPAEVFELLQRLGRMAGEMGYTAYAVGGFVRDILLQQPNLDLDLVIEGDGIKFAAQIVRVMGGRYRSHSKFRTAVVILPDGWRIDVATARLEYYEHPAALPTVELSSIKMDLVRRDFTINALAIQLNPGHFGELVDFFGGQKDIKERIIRVLHSLSFVDDPTRILRAVRFEQRFDFRIGTQTERLIKNALRLNMFHKLSGSRIFQELGLILEESDPLSCLRRLEELGIPENIHPLLRITERKEQILEEVARVLDWYALLYESPTPEVWKVFLLGFCEGHTSEECRTLLKRLQFSSKQEEAFVQLLEDMHAARKELVNWEHGEQRLSDLFFILANLSIEAELYVMATGKTELIRKQLSHYLSRLKNTRIEVSGNDLKTMGLTPGPAYSRVLNEVLRAKLDGEAPDRQSQLNLALELVREEEAPKARNSGEGSGSA
jgi:tRNA nucleotidyltransferase (CCA-adding enzyme)